MEQILFAIVIALALYVIFFPFFSSLDAEEREEKQ
jgi:cellobiose-specific phosphotransferase system component IIC